MHVKNTHQYHVTSCGKEKVQYLIYKINWKTRFKMAIGTYLSIITLNVNGLNARIKRQRVADGIIKQEPTVYCLQETHID